jgi:hypothetical protein
VVVKNEEVLRISKEERHVLITVKHTKSNWICHILHRNCLLRHVIEGKIDGKKRRGGRRLQLLGDLQDERRHCNVQEETLDRTVRSSGFVSDCGHASRQTTP